MKPGDLVRMKGDTVSVLGIIVDSNSGGEVSLGPLWNVFYFVYSRSIPIWESELEVISESR